MPMRTIFALLILGLSALAACEERKRPDVLDGEPLYIAQCERRLPGQACD